MYTKIIRKTFLTSMLSMMLCTSVIASQQPKQELIDAIWTNNVEEATKIIKSSKLNPNDIKNIHTYLLTIEMAKALMNSGLTPKIFVS